MKQLTTLMLSGALLTACQEMKTKETTVEETAKEELLADQLTAKKEAFTQVAPDSVKAIYNQANKKLAASDLIANSIQSGDSAIDFTLINAAGDSVTLSEELKKGPVVLMWYRGGWCPYCNIALHYMQEKLPEIKAAGGQLIAVSPEKPDESLNTQEKHNLEFNVLSDPNNLVAKQYGIVFKLDEEVADIYEKKFDLSHHNNSTAQELPLPATYVITQNGVVVYSFLDTDYRNRAEPKEVIKALESIQ